MRVLLRVEPCVHVQSCARACVVQVPSVGMYPSDECVCVGSKAVGMCNRMVVLNELVDFGSNIGRLEGVQEL